MPHAAPLLLLAACLPAVSQTGFQQTDLFEQGRDGVHSYRIPALVESRSGVLIAVADARHDSSGDLPAHISLVLRRSFDHGRTWTPQTFLRQVPEGGVGDASLLLDRQTGRVWCFHAYGPPGIGFLTSQGGTLTGPTTLQLHAMYSDDDGATWSAPADLTPQVKQPSWLSLFATSGTHIQTASGRLLLPLVVRHADRSIAAHNAYSDDAGRTWHTGPAIGASTDESHAVELAGNIVLQNLRTSNKTRAAARSHDGGITFDAAAPDPALTDPSCNAGITRYFRDGKDIVIFSNAASEKRENLSLKLSYDGGRTWPVARTLHAGPAAYSTVIVLNDGSLAVLYERGERSSAERITFARFSLDWITPSLR